MFNLKHSYLIAPNYINLIKFSVNRDLAKSTILKTSVISTLLILSAI